MKIRAAVLEEVGRRPPYAESRPLAVQEIDLEAPREGEALVEIRAAALCRADLAAVEGGRPRPLPLAMGREGAGVVRAVGPDVERLEPGDHVVAVGVPACGRCPPCRAGRPALCEPGAAANAAGRLLGGGVRLRRDGAPVHHMNGISCFADYAVMSANSLVRVPSDLPFESAALIGSAVLSGAGTVFNCGDVAPGARIAVVGLGGAGLSAVMAARAAGAAVVVAVDRLPDRLEAARALGATHLLDGAAAHALERIRDLTDGGVDAALDFSGSAAALRFAYDATRRGGVTLTAGPPGASEMLAIPAAGLATEERTLKGRRLGAGVPSRDIPRLLDLHAQGRLPVERLVTHRLTLDEINLGLDRLAAGEAIRQVIAFGPAAEARPGRPSRSSKAATRGERRPAGSVS